MTTQHQSASAAGRSIRTGALLLSLVGGMVCSGCLSRPALIRRTFAFQNPPPKAAPADAPVLGIRSVTVSPLFTGLSFVYRTGPVAYETDAQAGFLAEPGEAISTAIRSHLLASGRFRDVAEHGSLASADKFIEVYVSELYGDFSRAGQPAAVLSMRISLFNADEIRSGQPILQKDYSRRVPLQKNTSADVMAGWDTALNEIMTEAVADLSGR